MENINGIIAVNKPPKLTSFDVVRIIKKKFSKGTKVGHMGTLDPMATGVLPILIGSAAKFQKYSENSEKEYIAKFKLGILTDTLDADGEILKEEKTNFTKEKVKDATFSFVGEILQIPPMYSAIKINGQKLYKIARSGKEIERQPRKITIYEIDFLNFDEENQEAEIKVLCSKGTYVRSLCLDIGQKLGSFSTMTSLLRTKSNGFSLEDCINIEEIRELSVQKLLGGKFYHTDYLFKDLNPIYVTESQATRFKNGGALAFERLEIPKLIDGEILKIFFKDKFIGLGRADFSKKEIIVLKVL